MKLSRTKVPVERHINREPHPCKRACRSTLWSYKDCNKPTLLCSHKQWCDLLCRPQRIGKYWLVCQARTHNRTYYGNCFLMCTCLTWRRTLQKFCCTLFCGSKLANRTEIRRVVLFNLPPQIGQVLEFFARCHGCSRSSKWRLDAKFVNVWTAEDETMVNVYSYLKHA